MPKKNTGNSSVHCSMSLANMFANNNNSTHHQRSTKLIHILIIEFFYFQLKRLDGKHDMA